MPVAMSGKKTSMLAIFLLNAFIFVAVFALFWVYRSDYQKKLKTENLNNIANINQSSANIAYTYFQNRWSKLDDTAQYIGARNLTCAEALEYIYDSNSDHGICFQLIRSDDYNGWIAKKDDAGKFYPVSYAHEDYDELHKAMKASEKAGAQRCFTPEFTDNSTGVKSFALYTHTDIRGEDGSSASYVLMLVEESRNVIDIINVKGGYDELSTVLVDSAGNYILSNSDFRSGNLFQYFYIYNDLTLDQRLETEKEMAAKDSGELYYSDGRGRDCVFRYAAIGTEGLSCVTSVPVASFRSVDVDYTYTLLISLLLVVLLIADVIWFNGVNKRLKNSMAKEMEANSAKTDFLSRMSHDIRTPLNGVIGMTMLAADEKGNPPRTQEYLKNIESSGQFLLGLVNDVLDMSKVESGKMELHPEPYILSEFCRYISAAIEPLCKNRSIEFRMSCGAMDRAVMADKLRLNQIFFNLLSNSVKFTPSGGRVELNCSEKLKENGRVKLIFTVSDTGVGMSEEFQKRMFEAFSQERRNHSTGNNGTGLGLAIVKNLVDLMDGTISVKSREGEGTTFIVELETDIAEGRAAEPESELVSSLAGKRVLMVEDNAINITITERLLEKRGILSEVAHNGLEGVRAFEASEEGYYDAILMDMMMPVMGGLEAAKTIRALTRPDAAVIPIIAMTANAYDIDVQNCLEAGMNDHVAKPIDPKKMFDTIAKAVNRVSADGAFSEIKH